MSSIERWKPKQGSRSPRWRAHWRDPSGKPQSKVFDKKVAAEQHLVRVEHARLTGAYVDPAAGKVTFREYAEAWRARQMHRPSTQAQVETYLRKHVYPTFGDRPLGSVLRSDVQAWVAERSKVLSAGSVRLAYGFVASIYRDAVFDRVVHESPCQRIALPAKPTSEVVPPTREQVDAVLAALPDRYRAAGVLAAGAGLRLGEVLGLSLDRVDFLRRTIRVDRQLVTPNKGSVTFGPTKTPSSVRTVPMAEVVQFALARHVEQFPPLGEEHGDFAGLLFSTRLDTPVRRNTFADVWSAACRSAEVDGVRFHDLRHWFASALIGQGCSVKAVQAALGHKNATETLNTYAHLWPSDEDATRSAIQAALGAPVAQVLHKASEADGEAAETP